MRFIKKLKRLLHNIKISWHLYIAIVRFHQLHGDGFSNIRMFDDKVHDFWFNFYTIISTYVAIHVKAKGDLVAGSILTMFENLFKEKKAKQNEEIRRGEK